MIVSTVTIHDGTQAFTQALRDELCNRLQVAGDEIVRQARELVNIDGGRHNRSLPHDPPHRDYSLLYLSIDTDPVDRANLTVRAGSGIRYALYLELGTSKMKPRPWLRPALRRSEDFIRRTFEAPLPNSTAAFQENYRGILRYLIGRGY